MALSKSYLEVANRLTRLNSGSNEDGNSFCESQRSGDPLDVAHTAQQVWFGGRAASMRSFQTELRDRYLHPAPSPEAGGLPRGYPARVR